jgi:hypothetical protein
MFIKQIYIFSFFPLFFVDMYKNDSIQRMVSVLVDIPFIVRFHDRVRVWRRVMDNERLQYKHTKPIEIGIHRSDIARDGLHAVERLGKQVNSPTYYSC